MWCGGGDEMWGVSGQGSQEDEWSWRGQTGQLEHLFSFWFPIVFCSPQVHTDRRWSLWKRHNIRKWDFGVFLYWENNATHRGWDSYRLYIFNLMAQMSLDKRKAYDLLFIWAMWDGYLLTLLAFMSPPGSQIISDSNCTIHDMKCQYEILHNLAAWKADWPSIYCGYSIVCNLCLCLRNLPTQWLWL